MVIPSQILSVQIDYHGIWYATFFFAYVITLAVMVLTTRFARSFPLSIRLLFLYSMINGLYIAVFPGATFGSVSRSFQATAALHCLDLIFVPMGAILFYRELKALWTWAALFSCVCVWFSWSGLMVAPSFNTAFAALCIPFIPWWAASLVILTALTHHGSTALLVLGAEFSAVVFSGKRSQWWTIIPVSLFLVLIGWAWHHGALFDGEERLDRYHEAFSFWTKAKIWWVFGVGPGSYMWLSVALSKFKAPLFLCMHSDWLQILFEEGFVGWGLCVWVWIQAVKKASYQRVEHVAALLGIAAFALTYHPLRFYPTALLTAWIFYAVSCKRDLHPAPRNWYLNLLVRLRKSAIHILPGGDKRRA